MLVKEHINFERGLDPKVAMDIGDFHHDMVNVVDKILQNSGSPRIQAFKKVKTTSKDYEIFDINFYIVQKWQHPEGMWIILEAEENRRNTFYWIIWEGYNKMQNYLHTVNDTKTDHAINIIKDPTYFLESFLIDDKVTESINFERGLDPRDAMGIGLDPVIKLKNKLQIISKKYGFKKIPKKYRYDSDSTLKYIEQWYLPTSLKNEQLFFVVKKGEEKIWYTVNDKILCSAGPAIEWLDEKKWQQYFKKINESLKFERGLDPKAAMEIGLGDVKLVDNFFYWLVTKKFFEQENIWFSEDEILFFSDETVKNMNVLIKGFKEFLRKPKLYEYLLNYYHIKTEFIDDNIIFTMDRKYRKKIKSVDKYLKESINFERGLDPRDAMQTGNVQKREQDRVRKIMRRYMTKAMKEWGTNGIYDRLKFKKYENPRDSDLNYFSYEFKIQKISFQLKYYYNNPLWDLELYYEGMKRYINLPTTTLKDFVHEVRGAMLDVDIR